MRTDMHQRAFPGEDISDRPEPVSRRAGAAPADRRAAGERSVPGRGSRRRSSAAASARPSDERSGRRADRFRTGDFELPDELAATAPPPRRDRCACWSPAATGIRHRRFAEIGELARAGRPARRQHLGDAGRRRRRSPRGRRAVTVHFSTALDDGGWLVELRPATNATGPLRDVVAGERLELPDGVVLTVVVPFLGGASQPGCGVRRSRSRATWRPTWPVSGGRSATPTCPARIRSRPTRRCSRASPAARRCPVRPGRSPPSIVTDLVVRGSCSRRSCCTPACRPWRPGSRRCPSGSRFPRRRRGWST